METPKQYGWYSAESVRQGHGFCVYRTPNGAWVEVTAVTPTPSHDLGWKDMIFVGEVHTFIYTSKQEYMGPAPAYEPSNAYAFRRDDGQA